MTNLISFMGAPGAGKTYLAKELAKELKIYFLDRDILFDEFFGNDRESKYYKKLNMQITQAIWSISIENAKQGISNIIESPMTRVIQGKKGLFIDDTLKEMKKYNFNLNLIYCVAPEQVILTNLKKRGLLRDESKYEDWDTFIKMFVNVPGPIYDHIRIDTTKAIEDNLKLITSYLSS